MLRSITLLVSATALLALSIHQGVAATEKVGQIDKLQGQADASQGAQKRTLAAAGDVLFLDRIETGDSARMEATLGGALSINVKGAFLFVGGKIEGPTGGNVAIKTPVGTLGVRGTTVWGGFIDGGYGVLVLDGEVTVNTRHGQVTLQKGQGTMIYGNKAPNKAAPWPDQRVKAAVATITFK